MTEKRFTLFDDGETIFDNETFEEDGGRQSYWTVEYVQVVKLVELLNKLHEENEQLKQQIKELELLNDGLNYALQNIRKIDVEIDVSDWYD